MLHVNPKPSLYLRYGVLHYIARSYTKLHAQQIKPPTTKKQYACCLIWLCGLSDQHGCCCWLCTKLTPSPQQHDYACQSPHVTTGCHQRLKALQLTILTKVNNTVPELKSILEYFMTLPSSEWKKSIVRLLWHCDDTKQRRSGSTLVEIRACHLVGTKLFPEPCVSWTPGNMLPGYTSVDTKSFCLESAF